MEYRIEVNTEESHSENREKIERLQSYLDQGYLLHGSKVRVEKLEPRQATDDRAERKAGKALEELDRWLVQAPDSVQALIWKAYALGRLGLADKADRHLDLARERPRLRRDPELNAAYAFALDARGRGPEARDAYRSALEAAQRLGQPRVEAEILPRLAALQRRLGDETAAREAEARAKALPAPVEAED